MNSDIQRKLRTLLESLSKNSNETPLSPQDIQAKLDVIIESHRDFFSALNLYMDALSHREQQTAQVIETTKTHQAARELLQSHIEDLGRLITDNNDNDVFYTAQRPEIERLAAAIDTLLSRHPDLRLTTSQNIPFEKSPYYLPPLTTRKATEEETNRIKRVQEALRRRYQPNTADNTNLPALLDVLEKIRAIIAHGKQIQQNPLYRTISDAQRRQ